MLRQFGLARIAGEWLSSQSAGTQRLVLLARALVKRPPILLLDEPCQGLDEEHWREFIVEIEKLIRRRGVTVVYVTHRLEEIPKGTRNVMRLEQGVGGKCD